MTIADSTLAYAPPPPRRPRALSKDEVVTALFPPAITTGEWNIEEDWLPDVLVQLKEYDLLPEGWDGSVAPVPSRAARAWAAAFLEAVRSADSRICRPVVAPTVNGGIGIEWHGHGYHLDLEYEDDAIAVYATTPEGYEWEGGLGEETPPEVFGVLFNFRG